MMAIKAQIPTQVPMILFVPIFVVSFGLQIRPETADDLVSKGETLLPARANNHKEMRRCCRCGPPTSRGVDAM
jgi:hypothetical protein